MAEEKLPRLTEAHVRGLASEKSFDRGEAYYHDGSVLEPVRQEGELRAQCQGSDYEPYQVSVTLSKSGIAETSCTCPYDYGGICKHIVALLLTYVHEPQSFRPIPPLSTLLAGRSREELIALIGELIKREPELLSLVELSVATEQAKRGGQVDVAAYRRQTRRALRHESEHVVEKELRALRELAARAAKAGDWLNAGAIYHAVLDEAVRGYDGTLQEIDEDGRVAVVIDEFALGLSQCLKKSTADAETRRAWLETLLKAELTDIEMGGIDLAPSAREAVLEHADDEEWAWVEKRLNAAMSKSGGWKREALARFLAAGQKRHERTAEGSAPKLKKN
ncbi:MAG TPA: SWIM zinc finger family protein [Pyrinomonadaceae bacterium]|nr:SWIM zinc finger family protein [Pyrinomonadaceae bacterium]